jgi:hypothetical protein
VPPTELLETKRVKVDEKQGRVRSKKSSGRLRPMIKLSNKSSNTSPTILSTATVIVSHTAGEMNTEEFVPIH